MLSGGNQQKVVLVKWLGRKPAVLIVDEPTRGIDVATKAEMHHLLLQLARDGVGILMISSELPEVLRVSDRILVMREGRLMAEFAQPVMTRGARRVPLTSTRAERASAGALDDPPAGRVLTGGQAVAEGDVGAAAALVAQ
jgi:rhamnose transport system ATP-binding protein